MIIKGDLVQRSDGSHSRRITLYNVCSVHREMRSTSVQFIYFTIFSAHDLLLQSIHQLRYLLQGLSNENIFNIIINEIYN